MTAQLRLIDWKTEGAAGMRNPLATQLPDYEVRRGDEPVGQGDTPEAAWQSCAEFLLAEQQDELRLARANSQTAHSALIQVTALLKQCDAALRMCSPTMEYDSDEEMEAAVAAKAAYLLEASRHVPPTHRCPPEGGAG